MHKEDELITLKDAEKVLTNIQDQYFLRLEKLFRLQTYKSIVVAVITGLVIMFYMYLYFHTPYLTRNYVENGSGNVYQDVKGNIENKESGEK
jgi:hypothetical protein